MMLAQNRMFLFTTDYLHCCYIWREFTAGLYQFSALERKQDLSHCARVDRNNDLSELLSVNPVHPDGATSCMYIQSVPPKNTFNISHGNIRLLCASLDMLQYV